MNAEQARAIAKAWVDQAGMHIPEFAGAVLHGSINWLEDCAVVAPTSDVDIIVLLSGAEIPTAPGKFLHEDLLLDISYLAEAEVDSAEAVLGNSHLAGSFRKGAVLADPTGRLAEVTNVVARDYAKRRWVVERCKHACRKALDHLASLDESAPLPDQVTAVLFGAGVTTHVLLVAGLRNPTVRNRYVAVRELLAEHDRLDIHEELLGLLGSAEMDQRRVERHLDTMTEAFDVAKEVVRTQFFFGSDISDVARPIAVDGSRELIDRGYHREAMFWIAATWSRCMKILATDAPPDHYAQFLPGYRAMLADLGLGSYADLAERADRIRNYLPQLWAAAATIIAPNPELVD
jgi:hypothetical protein